MKLFTRASAYSAAISSMAAVTVGSAVPATAASRSRRSRISATCAASKWHIAAGDERVQVERPQPRSGDDDDLDALADLAVELVAQVDGGGGVGGPGFGQLQPMQ